MIINLTQHPATLGLYQLSKASDADVISSASTQLEFRLKTTSLGGLYAVMKMLAIAFVVALLFATMYKIYVDVKPHVDSYAKYYMSHMWVLLKNIHFRL